MKREEATLDYEYYKRDCDFEDLKYAVEELTHATEAQFKEIKNEKWYNRLFNMVTFSQKGKKRMAEQIGSLAQAQRIFMEILVRLSATDERVAGLVSACMADIRRLQENDVYLLQRIKKLEDVCILGIRETEDVKQLSSREKQILGACLHQVCELYPHPSEKQQKYANTLLNYVALGSDCKIKDLSETLSLLVDDNSKRKMLSCVMEYMFLWDFTMSFTPELKNIIEDFNIGHKTIKQIETRINDTYRLRGAEGFIDKYKYGQFEQEDIFYVEVEEDRDTEANTPSDESKSPSKMPEFTVVYERGQLDFAEQIGVDLRVKGKRVRVIPVQDENMDTINQIDWRIYVGKGGTASRILKSGKIDTIMNQYGCLLKTPRGSHLIVLYQEEDYDFFTCRDEFITYYQDMAKQLGFENEELASKLQVIARKKADYEDFDADSTVSMNALDGVLSKISNIADSIDDYGCSSNPLRRVGSVLFRVASLPVVAASTVTAIGGATGEITAKAVSDVKADIEFDKKIAAQVQQEILRMMLTSFLNEKQ